MAARRGAAAGGNAPAVKSAEPDAQQVALNLEQRHPHYDERSPVWHWNRDHWEGGRALVKKATEYLPKFQLENEENYSRRKGRAQRLYHNLVRSAVQVYISQLFRKQPDRTLPDGWDAYVDDVDMMGTKASRFFKHTGQRTFRDGVCFVLVDAPDESLLMQPPVEAKPLPAPPKEKQPPTEDERPDEQAAKEPPPKPEPDAKAEPTKERISEADAQELRLRPWFERIEAHRVIDWDVERVDTARRGTLNWVVIQDDSFERRLPFQQPEKVTRFRVYTRDRIMFYERRTRAKEGAQNTSSEVLTKDVANQLGEVPLVAFYDEFIEPMRGATVMDDVALTANALWNSTSVADEAYHYQGFSLLTIVSDADMEELKIGEDRGLRLPTGSTAEYLSPSAVPFEAHEKRAREMVERVADLVFQRTSRQLPTAQVESAEKKDLDRQEFVALLEEKAAGFEQAEKQCWQLFARYLQADPTVVSVTYNRKFRTDQRTVQDWKDLVAEHVASRVEWYLDLHPGVTKDEALEAIKENIEAEKELAPAAAAMDAGVDAFGNALDDLSMDGDLPPDDPNADPEDDATPPDGNAPPFGGNGKHAKDGEQEDDEEDPKATTPVPFRKPKRKRPMPPGFRR